jgi:hypothetical protein
MRIDAEHAAAGIEAATRASAENAAKLELFAEDLEAEADREEGAVIERYRSIERPAAPPVRPVPQPADDYY